MLQHFNPIVIPGAARNLLLAKKPALGEPMVGN
jgi:hypothetical protein